jgi:hypothetical protein
MENVLRKISVSKEKNDKSTKINDQYYGIKEKFDDDDVKSIKNILVGISSHPIFTNKSTDFNQASASMIFGDNRLNRHKMLFIMSLLRDKSGKKVFSLTSSNGESTIMCSNPTPLSMIDVVCDEVTTTTEETVVETATTTEETVDETATTTEETVDETATTTEETVDETATKDEATTTTEKTASTKLTKSAKRK